MCRVEWISKHLLWYRLNVWWNKSRGKPLHLRTSIKTLFIPSQMYVSRGHFCDQSFAPRHILIKIVLKIQYYFGYVFVFINVYTHNSNCNRNWYLSCQAVSMSACIGIHFVEEQEKDTHVNAIKLISI